MNMAQELNIVTGAFGYSGRYIARLLLSRGARVRILTGHPARANPFGDSVEVAPFDFDRPDALAKSLDGAATVFNTYWIRFPRGGMSFEHAISNVKALIDAAKNAGVRRFVHISITNASPDSPLPYFRGKGVIEGYLSQSGLSYAIVRPAVIFGGEEILLNNIAWLLRRFPIFAIPGNGKYRLQPVFVADLAELVVNAASESHDFAIDAVGPEVLTFDELAHVLARTVDSNTRLLHVNPAFALFFASIIGWLMHDVTLTHDEIRGLMADLLVSRGVPTAPTRFSEWLLRNAATIGTHYASELAKRS
jgi:uncharacterized protein YbjT (DUF2867 family)